MPLYATEADYVDYTGDSAAVLSRADLVNASNTVAAATVGAPYDLDGLGYPTDPVLVTALREATCELLRSRVAARPSGELADLAAAGLESATILGTSYKLRTDAAGQSAPTGGDGLTLAAARILELAGLLRSYVIVV